MKLVKLLYKLVDKLLPPIKFKEDKKKKELQPTSEDLDKWAEWYEREYHNKRKRKYYGK